MAQPEDIGESAGLRPEDVTAVSVTLRKGTCQRSPGGEVQELEVTGRFQWRGGSVAGNRVTLALREEVTAHPLGPVGQRRELVSIALDADAEITLSRDVQRLGQPDHRLLAELCRPYLLEIVAYLTGRMGLSPLLVSTQVPPADDPVVTATRKGDAHGNI